MNRVKFFAIATVVSVAFCAPVRATQTITISTADNQYRGILNQTSAYYGQDSPPVGVQVGIQGGSLPIDSLWAFSIPANLPQVIGATLKIPYGTFTAPGSPTPYDTLNLVGSIESIAELFSGHSTLHNGQPWPGDTAGTFGSVSIYPGGDPSSYVSITLTPAAVQWINAAVPGMPPEGNFGRGGDGWMPVVGVASYGNNLALSSSSPALLQLTVVPEPTAWVLGLLGAALLWFGRRCVRAQT